MLFVVVEKVTGGVEAARRPRRPPRRPDAGGRAWTGGPLRWRDVVAARLALVVPPSRRCWSGCAGRSQLRAAGDAEPAAVPLRRGRSQAESLADAPWFQVFDDPTLQALIQEAIANNLDLRVAVARVEEVRARAGIAKSFLYPQVDGVANYGVRQASNAPQDERPGRRRHDPSERHLRLPAVLGARSVRSHPAREGSGARARARERAGPPRRARHARRRRRDELLPAARARPAARDRATDARPQRRDRHLFPEPAGRRRVEPARARSDPCQPGADGCRHSRNRTADRHRRERDLAAARTSARADHREPPLDRRTSRCRRRFRRACPRRCSSGGPTSSQAEQFLVAANADIGAAKALFFPTISLTGFLGGVSGDLSTFLGGGGGGVVRRRRAASADLPGRPPAPEPRGDAGAIRRGAGRVPEGRAQRLPRSRQRAGDDSEAGRSPRAAARPE